MNKANFLRLFIYCLFVCFIQCSYAINVPAEGWEVKKVYKWELVKKELNELENSVINMITQNFAEEPYYENYRELQYFGHYHREEDDTKLLFFYNRHVDGIQIVYELNASHKIIDRYIVSEWQ